jgi:hypothetical protein
VDSPTVDHDVDTEQTITIRESLEGDAMLGEAFARLLLCGVLRGLVCEKSWSWQGLGR